MTLHHLPVEEACRVKGEAGKREHRKAPGAPFVGDPLIEAYAELIDLLNYLDEAALQGEDCAELRSQVERWTHWLGMHLRTTRDGQAVTATAHQ